MIIYGYLYIYSTARYPLLWSRFMQPVLARLAGAIA